jgi:hypothetical protein
MRKTFYLLLVVLLLGGNAYSQKKNGTVYSEHESIDKTRALWKAFVDGDKDKYVSFFADSLYAMNNGQRGELVAAKELASNLDWWKNEWENLKIEDHKPAYPDATEYKEGGVWVSDWLLVTGRHKKSGINIELPLHTLYSFNKAGKIVVMDSYFNNDIFEEIRNSEKTAENGKVYINHPYIAEVRNLVNAHRDRNLDKWASFFAPDAQFMASWAEFGDSKSLKEIKEMKAKSGKDGHENYKIEEVGYPDCIYYAKSDAYVVYSWWHVSYVKDGKKVDYPLMLSHSFNEEGKIVSEFAYASSNHWK